MIVLFAQRILPGPAFHQIKRTLKRYGITTCATSGRKLGSVLCAKNRTRPPPTHSKGVYLLKCTCCGKAVYVRQTIQSICQRYQEHKRAAEKDSWAHSGIAAHEEHCKEPVDWEKPTVLALEIRRHNCGPGLGLNEVYSNESGYITDDYNTNNERKNHLFTLDTHLLKSGAEGLGQRFKNSSKTHKKSIFFSDL